MKASAHFQYITDLPVVKGVIYVPEKLGAGAVNDGLCLRHRQVKFSGQGFKRDAINEPPLKDRPVSLGVAANDPLIDVGGDPVSAHVI